VVRGVVLRLLYSAAQMFLLINPHFNPFPCIMSRPPSL
jgi:hypothetical protein